MVEPSDESSIDLSRSNTHHSDASSRATSANDSRFLDPLKDCPVPFNEGPTSTGPDHDHHDIAIDNAAKPSVHDAPAGSAINEALPPSSPPLAENNHGDAPPPIDQSAGGETKANIFVRFYTACKEILFASWINVLLIFVPVGITVQFMGVSPNIVFAMNAIAIIPLAGSLSYATECVASEMGDTVGSLMNVTFGNAVELIIFIIALTKNEIRIVQASLLGSILANLLLILGMCFLFGGLRFREQVCARSVRLSLTSAEMKIDLQQRGYSNECVSSKSQRDESLAPSKLVHLSPFANGRLTSGAS